jgi:hypothetical protein
MKTLGSLTAVVFICITLASCDEVNVSMETTVHPDGKLDKTITLEQKDSSRYFINVKDWNKSFLPSKNKIDSTKEKMIIISFTRKFNSVDEANAELAAPSDTMFRVSSKFEKKFRWFYTYMYYADTYYATNRLNYSYENYLAPEDHAFIDRLPAEGTGISKADSLYLGRLQEKLYDFYGFRAIYEAYWNFGLQLIKENNLENKWIDSINLHKENIYERLVTEKDIEDDIMIKEMESLQIPLPYEKSKLTYNAMVKEFRSKTDFIRIAQDSKYSNRINLPWPVVNTNADSVSGNSLFWTPPPIKFLLKDYTMYGECRKLNWWAVIVSVLVVGFTGYLFVRKRN